MTKKLTGTSDKNDKPRPKYKDWLTWASAFPATAVAVALGMLPSAVVLFVAFGLVVVIGTTVDAFHKLRKPIAAFGLVLMWAALTAQGVRATFGAGDGSPWVLLAIVLSFAGLITVVGWQGTIQRWQWGRDRILKVNQRRFEKHFRNNWPEITKAAHMPKDVNLIKPEVTANGSLHLTVSTPGDAGALQQSVGNVSSVLKVAKNQVNIVPDRNNNSIGHIYVQKEDPFKDKMPWPLPSMFPTASICTGFPIGANANGQSEFWKFIGAHWLVGGTTRSGKTHFLQMITAWVTACDNAELWLIDTAKRGSDFQRWEHAARVAAITSEQADDALRLLYKVMEDRYTNRRVGGFTGQWDPDREGPQIVCVIDEASNAVAHTKKRKGVFKDEWTLSEVLQKLAAEAAGAGITMIIGTQTPQHKIFDINTRRNTMNRISFNVESGTTSDLVLGQGWAAQGYDASKLAKHGHAYAASSDWEGGPRRIRCWWVEHHELDAAAVSRPDVEHEWPHPTVEPPIDESDEPDDTVWLPPVTAPVAIPSPDMPALPLIRTNDLATDVRVVDKGDLNSHELPNLKWASHIVTFVADNPGCIQADVHRSMPDVANRVTVRTTLAALVKSGHLRQQGRAFAVRGD